jgi:hypothetical protein
MKRFNELLNLELLNGFLLIYSLLPGNGFIVSHLRQMLSHTVFTPTPFSPLPAEPFSPPPPSLAAAPPTMSHGG